MVAAVSGLNTQAPLQTRVGIATGLVVVGDLIGSGASQEQAIVGETPNLAARLQGVAEPNSVVIAESTRKLVGSLFELRDLGGQDLKGITGSMRAWAAVRPALVESRFDALHAGALTELIGREEELELLLRRWSKAKSGEGQVVLLSGEPGIGKSRLTAALMERLAAEPHTRLRYFCSPQHTDSALYPIISQMERAAGFTHDDNTQAKLDKLAALLARSFTPRQDAALLADMLSLPNDGRYPTLELVPQQRRQKTLQALTAQMHALSRSHPVLMIFEDVHWIDPTSLEVVGQTVERLKALPVLLIVTYRPEFDPPWIGRPYVTALNLNRLGEREIAAMIDRVTGNKAMPDSIRQDIIERTDGIPLFVEEMTKAVLEAEGEGGPENAVATIPSLSIGVPATLHASLMARLDRLGPAKEVAQIGAVIGREFSHSLMMAVSRKPQPELELALYRLVDAGLLFRQGVPPYAGYLFKHALVQDAAYGTLLREPRRSLHARIAETLDREFPEIDESQPELLARHYTEAGLIEKAAYLWGKAGQRSAERSALVEAVEQLTRALDLIVTLPSTPALRRERIKLQVGLITPLYHVKGAATTETKTAAERARQSIEEAEALGEPLEDPLLLFSVLYGFWVGVFAAFNADASLDLATQFLSLADKQGASAPLMVGHRITGVSLVQTGELAKGRAHLDRAIALYDPAEHRDLASRFGQDARVAALSYRSLTLWLLGYPESALADVDRALPEARRMSHAATLMYVLTFTNLTHIVCGNYEAVTAQSDEAVALADEKGGAPYWKAHAMIERGRVLAMTGEAVDAVHVITSGIGAFRSTGATLYVPYHLSSLASTHADLGQFDDARRCIGEAITAIEAAKEGIGKQRSIASPVKSR